MTQRVEIPAYTDRWMMGDRMGTITKTRNGVVDGEEIAIAHVKLETSGKTIQVVLDHCTVRS